VRDWALAARHGFGSPTRAPFATVKVNGVSVDGWKVSERNSTRKCVASCLG
jgi:hypothetical protein